MNCELESNTEGSGGGIVNVLSRPNGLTGQSVVLQCELVEFFFPLGNYPCSDNNYALKYEKLSI